MDPPDTYIHMDREDALQRKTKAVASGLIVDIGGLSTSLHASDAGRVEAIAHLLSDALEHPGPPELAVRFTAKRVPVPKRPPDVQFTGMDLWYESGKLWMKDESGVTARADHASLLAGGETSDAFPLESGFRRLFHIGMAHTLAHHDRFVLHGGAILAPGGRAVLVIGGSRSGKSSLVVVGLHHAWPPICDDMLVVREERDGHLVTGIPRPIKVPSDVARDLGIVSPQVARRRPRTELHRGLLRSGWWPVGAVLVAGHGQTQGGELRALAPREVFSQLVAGFAPSPEPGLFRRFYQHAAALSRLPAWEVLHDPDPSRRVASAARLLDSVRSLLGTAPP